VKPGFARNFLLPQGKAILATEGRVAELEHHKRIVAEKIAREMKDLQAVKKKIEKLKVEVGARAGDEGKLFGSVTAAQIAEQLSLQGLSIDRRRIEMDPIKTVGAHDVQAAPRRRSDALAARRRRRRRAGSSDGGRRDSGRGRGGRLSRRPDSAGTASLRSDRQS
jgi:large subunit ribosomal protein L9